MVKPLHMCFLIYMVKPLYVYFLFWGTKPKQQQPQCFSYHWKTEGGQTVCEHPEPCNCPTDAFQAPCKAKVGPFPPDSPNRVP
jgi:hypothetical protein